MKKLMNTFLLTIAILFFSVQSGFAQDNPLLVTSFNKVKLGDMGKVNKQFDSLFAPILRELVDEGMIFSFGQFNHAWGDEWNMNVWYTAKDMASFSEFWDEYVKRVSDRHPGAWGSMVKYNQAHKDNMYTIRSQYPEPPEE